MALRIYGRGLSPNGVEYTASIFDTDWGGASTLVDLVRDGIKITYNEDDLLKPVHGSVCTIEMLAEANNSTHTTFLDDLRTSSEGRFYVEITADGGSYPVLWRGIVTPDTLTNEQDNSPRYPVTITAVCGLALLKTIPYLSGGTALYTGREKLVSHLCKALTKLSHVSSLWAGGDDFIETSADWWAVGMTRGGANDPFNLSYVDHAAFYDYFTKGGIEKDVLSCYDVVSHIVSSFGCRILMRGGKFVIEQIDYRANKGYEYRRYDTAAAATTNGSYTGVQTINQTKTSGAKLSFVEYDYIPQLTKASVTYENRLRRNFWGNIIMSEGTTYNFDQEISSNSGLVTFRIRGLFYINIKNNTYSGNPQDVLIPEMRIMLKVGSNYLKRTVSFSNFAAHYNAAEWTATNTDRFAVVASGQQVPASGLSIQYVTAFDFITPPLPSDGSSNSVSGTFFQLKKNDGSDVTESEFTVTWTAGSMFMEVYDSGTPDVYEDEVLYNADNPDGGTDVFETSVRLGGGGTPNYAGRLTLSGGSEATPWGQGVGTRDKALGSVLAKRIVDGRLRPKKRLNGDIYANNIDPRKLLETSDTIDWLHGRITWRPTENMISGTWVEMDYADTSSAATPIKVKVLNGPKTPPIIGPITPIPTTGGGNQGFASNNPPAVLQPLAFNTLSSAITSGATITSISVTNALAGNEFLVGDEIVVVHPVSGKYQKFSVSSVPAGGATSISVTSAIAEFDVPQTAGLFIQQKAYAFSLPAGTHEGSILRWDDVAEVWEPYDGTTDGYVLTWDTTNGWQEEAASGGGVSDGDKGDITVSSSGTVWTIDNNVVSFAKFQQITTDRLLGRDTAATGNVEEISLNSTLEFTGAGSIQRAALTGDVTASAGSNSTTIANSAVTLAKMADVATSTVFYRKTAGAGAPEVQTLATLKTDLGLTGTNSGDVTLSGENYLSIAGQVITAAAVNLSGTNVTGTLAAARFGALTGDVTNTAGSYATTISNNAVSDAKLRDSAALSVIGRATNTLGDPADIAAANDGEVLRRSGTSLGFGTVATAGIANSAVTYAKIQNVSTNNRLLGRSTAGAGVVEEITIGAGLSLSAGTLSSTATGTVTGTGTANQIAYWSGTSAIAGDTSFTIDATNDRVTITGSVAGTGANNAWLNLNAGSITGTAEALRASANLSTALKCVIANARNLGNSGDSILEIQNGGTAAGDSFVLFSFASGGTNYAAGIDNSDLDKFKITPGGTAPGSTANKGLILTVDAATLVGINKDVPKHALDVTGRVMSSTGFIGTGSKWISTNFSFGTGAGTSPTFNSSSGTDNAFTISFTTGTTPTANGTIFTATYPNAWPGSWNTSFVVFSALNANAATDITKFRISTATATSFLLVANGTLSASTNYQLTFHIWSMDSA